ncbi:MAG: class I SAM-dependent methyltransferase [Cyanobacteria bacterium J06642_9]
MIDKNKEIYTTASVVWHYKQLSRLQPAEKTILARFQDRLPTMKMLDIGIGGGRTTQHFAPLAAEYTGIDYSTEMIAACQQRFLHARQCMSLEVGDARNLSQFSDDAFDFILFSFNGIDSVSHTDRLQVFQEIQRIGKPGSYFFFSSHNLQGIAREFEYKRQISLNPLKTYANLVMSTLLKLFNASITRDQLRTADYLILKDEAHNFRLQTYYIRPKAQIKQLAPHFNDIEIYSWKRGLRILDPCELSANSEMWLYYLCVID